jgi:hypothetical protein
MGLSRKYGSKSVRAPESEPKLIDGSWANRYEATRPFRVNEIDSIDAISFGKVIIADPSALSLRAFGQAQ